MSVSAAAVSTVACSVGAETVCVSVDAGSVCGDDVDNGGCVAPDSEFCADSVNWDGVDSGGCATSYPVSGAGSVFAVAAVCVSGAAPVAPGIVRTCPRLSLLLFTMLFATIRSLTLRLKDCAIPERVSPLRTV